MIAQTDPITGPQVRAAIDYAAQQSDRWLFVALLVIGLFAMWMLVKYFTAQIKELRAELAAINLYVREKLGDIVAKTETALGRSANAVEENTTVLQEAKGSLWAGRVAKAVTGPAVGLVLALVLCGCAHWTPQQRAAVGYQAVRLALYVAETHTGETTKGAKDAKTTQALQDYRK